MMAAGSRILTICLCRGESNKKSQNQDIRDKRMIRMKGKAEGWGTDERFIFLSADLVLC